VVELRGMRGCNEINNLVSQTSQNGVLQINGLQAVLQT